MRKGKMGKVIKSKRRGSEWRREEQRRKGGTPAPRGVTDLSSNQIALLCIRIFLVSVPQDRL